MYISYFDNPRALNIDEQVMTWGELRVDLLNPPTYPSKTECPLIKLARFGNVPSPKGSLRYNENMLRVSGIEGDYDDGRVSVQSVVAMLTLAGIECVVVSTASHTEASPRWRIFAPLNLDHPPSARHDLCARLDKAVGGILARESYTDSQSYYVGRVTGVPFEAIHVAGMCLDLCNHITIAPKQVRVIGTRDTIVGQDVLDDLASALQMIPNDDRDTWQRAGHALSALGEAGRALWMPWSATSPKHDPVKDGKTWDSFNPREISYKTIFTMAERYGWANPRKHKPLDVSSAGFGVGVVLPGGALNEAPVFKDWWTLLDEHVAEMNKTHASVVMGGKHRIVRVGVDGEYEFFARKELELLHDSMPSVQVGTKEVKGEIKPVMDNPLRAWAMHTGATCYSGGVKFMPLSKTCTGLAPNILNLWRGFAVDPVDDPEATRRVHAHIHEVLCGHDGALYAYLLNWIAHSIQRPQLPGGSIVAFRGEEGSGKGVIASFVQAIWGRHGIRIGDSKRMLGNFNAHLGNACFVFADEAFFAGDKAGEKVLKGLVTEDTNQIERKGFDVETRPNFLKIWMATNSDYVVPVFGKGRRICVFDVTDNKIGDRAYFKELASDCKSVHVQAAFLHEMLGRDITGFHTGEIPETMGLRSQRYDTLTSAGQWLAKSLIDGEIGPLGWCEVMANKIVYDHYKRYCETHRFNHYDTMSAVGLGRYLAKMYAGKAEGADRHRVRVFGELEAARAAFEKYHVLNLSELDL